MARTTAGKLTRSPAPQRTARGADGLQRSLVEDLVRSTGARRVLLVLEAPEGPLEIAGARLPSGESAAALLQAVTPWLNTARRTRAVHLRHGPAGADKAQQRSCMVAPLVAGQEVLGYLYADIEGRFGRFADSHRDRLAMLAAQAAVATAHAHRIEDLEAKVTEQAAALEQRAAELALINRIQQGMAAKLGFQDIVDLVGDKLRVLFKSEDLSIRW